jgi:hypothetical protein
MKINKLVYGLEVLDDDGAEIAVYILGSPGQSGHCSLVIVLMAVDGGIAGLPSIISNFPYSDLQESEIPDAIRVGLNKIHGRFVINCPFLNHDCIEEIIKEWEHLMNGESEPETSRVEWKMGDCYAPPGDEEYVLCRTINPEDPNILYFQFIQTGTGNRYTDGVVGKLRGSYHDSVTLTQKEVLKLLEWDPVVPEKELIALEEHHIKGPEW